jgi:GT2 family glycosyltransferase
MISIVTGTLNRQSFLENLIENTVLSSDRVELILVDGGSSDSTIEYIKDVNHPRIKLIEVGKRSSYPHYMNLGIRNSSFDLICQWNDDTLLINSWDDVIEQLEDNVDFYLFNWKYGNLSDMRNLNWLDGTDTSADNGGWCVCNTKDNNGGGEIVMNYGIYSKNIFKEIGMYDSKFNYYYADGDMAERAWHFDYNVKTLRDIKVISLTSNKMAIHFGDDESKWGENQQHYKNKIIPDTVEYLTE